MTFVQTFRVYTSVYDQKTGRHQPTAIDLKIDFDALGFHLAKKASKNKSGKSRIQGGTVTGQIITK